MELENNEDRWVACAQYVIGLLSDEEVVAFEQRLVTDNELAGEVARWQDSLSAMTSDIQVMAPAADLWHRIAVALPDQPVAPVARTATAGPGEQADHASGSLWKSLAVWRTLTGLGFALSLFLGYQIVFQAPEAQLYVAVLKSPEAERSGWMVQANSTGDVRLVPLEASQPVPPDKALQLWTKLPGADKPVSLGLVKPGEPFRLSAESLPGLAAEQLFEITLEQPGGSPTGLPTGPIQFIGRAERI